MMAGEPLSTMVTPVGAFGHHAHYRATLRGPADPPITRFGKPTGKDYYRLTEGEMITVVALNRATGYIGQRRLKVPKRTASGIEIFVPIRLYPPCVEIEVERQMELQGLAKGQTEKHFIGFEGLGLSSDRYLTIRTNWMDHKRKPLPAGLPPMTGRFARIDAIGRGSPPTLFSIGPGYETKTFELGSDVPFSLGNYYLHVDPGSKGGQVHQGTGKTINKATFASRTMNCLGSSLERPCQVSPVRVATETFVDVGQTGNLGFLAQGAKITYGGEEVEVRRTVQKYNKATKDFEITGYVLKLFNLRPEHMFRVYRWEASRIVATDTDTGETTDLLGSVIPALSLSGRQDLMVQYALEKSSSEGLPSLLPVARTVYLQLWDGALHEVTVLASGQILIDGKEIQKMAPVDDLFLDLFVGHDPENPLWRFEIAPEDVYIADDEPDPDPHPDDKDASGVDVASVELTVNGTVIEAEDLKMLDVDTRQPVDINDEDAVHYRVRIPLVTLVDHLRVGVNDIEVKAKDNAGGEIESDRNRLIFDLTQEALDAMKGQPA